MAKTKTIFFLTFCFLFLANTVLAQGPCEIVHTQGIVPCSLTGANRCTLCHFFEMLNRIVNYILFCLIPPVAVFMLVIGGLLYIGAVFEFLPGGMETVSRAKRLFVSVIIGMLIAYSAWLIINLFLMAIGYRNWQNWWQIQCGTGPGGGTIVGPPPPPPPAAGGAVAAVSLPFEDDTLENTPLDTTVSSDEILYEWQTEPIFGLGISGSVTLNSPNSFARVILEDTQGKEYLVFEAFGPFNSGKIDFEKACKETCILNGVIPKRLRSEIENAQLTLTQKSELTAQNKDKSQVFLQAQAIGIENYQQQLLKETERLQISIINNYNKQKGLRWQAGETGVSSYTYAEKKALLGTSGKLPNLMGFEYYKGGIFEIEPPKRTTQVGTATQTSSNFPSSFDWRNRHGKNWMTSVKNQSEPYECGSCWAFATAAVAEAAVNLYFNQNLNLDLSEQQLVSCVIEKGCCGIPRSSGIELINKYVSLYGLPTEDCFPYSPPPESENNFYCFKSFPAAEPPCKENCKTLQKGLSPFKFVEIYDSSTQPPPSLVKEKLITKGPLWAAVDVYGPYGFEGGHAMALVGYIDDFENPLLPIYIYKNSWGENWGEKGYVKVGEDVQLWWPLKFLAEISLPVKLKDMPNLVPRCTDSDNDNYCFWGLGPKPDTCPASCRLEPDCDDSDAKIGPFVSYDNYKCVLLESPPTDIIPPRINSFTINPNPSYVGEEIIFKAEVSDDQSVEICKIFVNFLDGRKAMSPILMNFSPSPCKRSCTAYFKNEKIDWADFSLDTQLIALVKCWDAAGNESTSNQLTFEIKSERPYIIISEVNPKRAKTNVTQEFSVSINSIFHISSCNFYINENKIGSMKLSSHYCNPCTAYINHRFTSAGRYSAYVECKDSFDNVAKSNPVEIIVSDSIQYVTVRPIEILDYKNEPLEPNKIEVNTNIKFLSSVSSTSGKKISGCFLMINNENKGQLNLTRTNCYECEIWKDHIFNQKGVYSAYIKCVDEGGNVGESERINITVIDKQCPQLEYPNHMWQRVWYDNKNNTCLGQGFNESNIKFDNNWQRGEVAFGKSDDIKLSSSRTINFPVPGEYTFTVGSDDGVKVWIDDVLYLDRWRDRSYTTDTFKVNLTAGNHRVRIDYYEKGGSARLSFSYQEPSGPSIGQYTLSVSKTGNGSGTITSSPSGINCGQVCSANFNSGTYINLTALPSSDSVFTGWSGACSGTGTTCAVSMNANKSVIANFTSSPNTYTLSVNRNPPEGGTVYSGDYTINCGSVCSAAYNPGKSVTLYASPAGGYVFSGWTGGGCSVTGSCTVTMNSNQTVTANFNRTTVYNLTINKNVAAGGIIQGTPAVYCGTNCGPKITIPFDAGTTVTLSATPASGYTFGGWSGACSGTGTCTITMNSDKSVSASFIGGSTPIPTPTPTKTPTPTPLVTPTPTRTPTPTPTRTPTPTPTSSGTWTPCDPTYGWQCDRITGGNPPYCSGTPISWGSGDDGLVYCPEGQIAISGICEKKNDDYVKESKEIINLLPHPQVVSSTPTIFKPRSAWYCKFGCTGLFCGPDGCGWAYCKSGQIQIQRIELQIFDATGRLVFQRTVDNQNQISWDGKNDKGEYLANGFYIFQAKTYLKDGRTFTNQDKVYVQR